MSNIFKKLGIGVADLGKWMAEAIGITMQLAKKIESILKAAEPLQAPFIEGLSTVVADVEALLAASGTAVSANGLNFAADSAAYQHFVALVADFQKLAPVVNEAIAILEGKTVSATATE